MSGERTAQIVALWQSGELVRVMRAHATLDEAAAALGMTKAALESAIARARTKGLAVPTFSQARLSQPQAAASDPVRLQIAGEWDEEPTCPFAQIPASDGDQRPETGHDAQIPTVGSGVTDLGSVSPLVTPGPLDAASPAFAGRRGATSWARPDEDYAAFDAQQQPITQPQQQPIVQPTIAESLAERRRKLEIASLKSRVDDLLAELEQCQFERDTAFGAAATRNEVTPIVPRETTSGLREATAVALASDWHIEERVDAASVNGVNVYNLDIARRRVERYFSGLSYLIRYHQDHFSIRDLILWLGGDLITGYLREENLEHNELSPVQAIATLLEWIPQGVRSVLAATDIDKIRIPCSSGNHGRLTEKVRPSTREANSIEWLLYHALAREFASEERVEFTLPQGSQTYVNVYGFVIRFTHGDETKFGGGIGGIMIPLRKAIAKWQTVRHADLNCIGHYHQEHFLRDLIVNGSLIGYSPYSLAIAAPYEDPRQAFFLVDRRRGVTFPSTIWVADHEEN